jgi:hypothetical protein
MSKSFWPQLAVNAGTNAILTFGTDFATHKGVDGNDWLSFALNTAMGTALHAMNQHGDAVTVNTADESIVSGQPALSPAQSQNPQQLPLWDPAVFPISQDSTAATPTVEEETSQTDVPQRGTPAVQQLPLWEPADFSQNDFSYDPATGTVKVTANGEPVTARFPRSVPQQLSASDVALPGESWEGKAFAIYEKGSGGYGIRPIVSLPDGTPALWGGQGTPPSAAKLQAGLQYYDVYQATPENPVSWLTNGEYVILPPMAGGENEPSQQPNEAQPQPQQINRSDLGPLIGRGTVKDVYAYGVDQVVAVLKPGQDPNTISTEIKKLNWLQTQGFPTVQANLATVDGHPAMVMDRYAEGSNGILESGSSQFLNQQSIDDLTKIRNLMNGKQKFSFNDLQFLVDRQGHVVMADPENMYQDDSFLKSNNRLIDSLIGVAQKNAGLQTSPQNAGQPQPAPQPLVPAVTSSQPEDESGLVEASTQPAPGQQPGDRSEPEDSKNWPVKGKAPAGSPLLAFMKKAMFWGRNPPGETFTPEKYDELRQKLLANGQIKAGDYPATYSAFKVDDHTILLAWLPETPGDTDIHFHTYTFSQTFSTKGHPGAFDDFLRSLNLPKGVEEFLGKDNITNYAFNVAKMVTPGSEVSLGPVPYYCGVFQGHYTGEQIQQILMTNLAQLDNRTVADMQQVSEMPRPTDAQYLPALDDNNLPAQNPNDPPPSTLQFNSNSLQKFDLRARLHATITALDFSGKGPDPVQAILKLLQGNPLKFAHFGELTFNKEHVQVQRGAEVNYETFGKTLTWLRDQGLGKLFTVIHNDWSRVGTDPNNKRPLTVKGSYENLVEAVKFWTDPELKDLVQPVFAHTGIGRTSRGSDVPTPDLTFEYYDSNGTLQTETRGFSDHIEVMRFLKEKIPNLVFDFSWNDVTKNYIESPVLGQKFKDWVMEDNPNLPKEQQNRFSITIGSDAVRPVFLQQKNQGINTFLPILADLARSGPIGEEAVLNLVSRNYARLLDDAYGQQVAWWENNIANGTEGFDAQKYNAAKTEFDLLQSIRNGLRDDQGNLILGPDGQTPVWEGSRAYLEQKWTAWIDQVKSKGEVDPSQLGNPGFLVSLFRDTPDPHQQPEPPHSSDPPVDKWWKNPVAYAAWSWNDGWLRRGELTAGGAKNNPADSPDPITQAAVKKLRESSWLLGTAAVGLTALDAHFFARMPLGRILHESGFVTRGVQFLARDTWNENVRVFRENLTEQGHLTPEALNEFVNPIWRAAKEKDFSDLQLFNVAGATLQFWNNYQELFNRPIETGPDATWTASARGQAILAKVGEFTSTLASILNVDPASLSPFASTAPWGIQMRAALLLTYMANVGYAIGTTVGTNLMTDLTPTDHTNPAVFATKAAFALTNAIAGAWTAEGLASGIAGRNMEGHPWMQKAQALIQTAFTIDGGIWAAGVGWQTVTDIVANHGPVTSAADVVELAGILAWTYAANRNRVAADAAVSGKPQPHTNEAWKTVAIMAVGLAVTQVMSELISDGATKAGDNAVDAELGNIFKWIQSIGKQQTPKVTPTPTYTPTPTPVTIPLPHHQ